MTTTDTDALTERLWDAIFQSRDTEDKRGEAPTESIVAAVLPIVAVEVRKAKAEAWDEAYWEGQADSRYDFVTPNPYRETGDSDEHR